MHQDRDRIAAVASQLGGPLTVRAYLASEGETTALGQFATLLQETIPQIDLRREALADGAMPYLQIGESLRCAWVPKEEKLALILETLIWASGGALPPALEISAPDLPAAIRLYLADTCPHCHQILKMLLPLGFADTRIRLTLIDAQMHASQSERDGVRSVPTTILDDFRWSGVFPLEELLNLIRRRDPANLGPAALEMMLADGQAEQLADLMRSQEKIFPAFYDVVTHPLWSVRLGALVVVESLAESTPRLALSMARPLWERYPGLDTAAKGDVVYLLGEVGAVALREELAAQYAHEADPELREALNETLEKLT